MNSIAKTCYFLVCMCLIQTIIISKIEAQPEVKTTTKYYEVEGDTEKSLRKDMNSKRPTDPADGKKVDALTKWQINWTYKFDEEKKNVDGQDVTIFKIKDLDVKVSVVYTLPKRKSSKKASQELVEKWKQYMKNLKKHEEGHKKNAVKYAKIMVKEMVKFEAASTQELETLVNDFGNKQLKKANKADIKYDKKTKHGATEGATFP